MTKINQNFTMWSGDDRDLIFTIYDGSGASQAVSGGSAVWILSEDPASASIIRKDNTSSSDVTLSGSTITVSLLAADTASLMGVFYHELQILTTASKTATAAVGIATIHQDVIV